MEKERSENLRNAIISDAKEMMDTHPGYRYGQSVFNIVDMYIGLARDVQFYDHVDCFYDDNMVDEFIDRVIERIDKREAEKENQLKSTAENK